MINDSVTTTILLPYTVIDWLNDRPPCLLAETILDISFSLAQCMTEEENFDVEMLVEGHMDYLFEEFLECASEAERDRIEEYESFFIGFYHATQSLFVTLELDEARRGDDIIRFRINTLRVDIARQIAVVTLNKDARSLFFEGAFDYLKLEAR